MSLTQTPRPRSRSLARVEIVCDSNPCPCLRPGESDSASSGTTTTPSGPAPGGGAPAPDATGAPSGGGGSQPAGDEAIASEYKAVVVRAVDGDTIVARPNGKERRVRLIGIDTPEVFAARSGSRECGGREASAFAKRLAKRYRKVVLRTDPTQDEIDRYGRLLAYVDLPDSRRSYQSELLKAGWAKTYVYEGKPFARVKAFRKVQATAKKGRRGVYAKCNGDFRRPV